MNKLKPNQKQIDYQSWEMGIFVHFGIRTFYEGHKDWDGQKMSADQFNPTALDCEQWAKTASDGGANYMVLTAKHHDGFANWPSKYTDFSVKNSPWKDGKGDVVQEYTDACRKYGLKVGIYYSPADWTCPVYDEPEAYDNYFIDQVSELLDGRYGEINILWFDGCGSENHEYNWPRIIAEIRKMQPNILIFNMGDPDFRWIGNECGLADMPTWNTVDSVDFSIMTDNKDTLGERTWLPAECDFMMRDRNWFYSDSDAHTVKTLPELMGNYYYSVGRGCNMLLNIGPDRNGLFPKEDSASLIAFGQEVEARFSNPSLTMTDFKKVENNTWVWKSPNFEEAPSEILGTLMFDHIVLQENLENGESVKRFKISITPYLYGKPITIYEGHNIGHKAICKFPLVRCKEIIVEILKSDGDVELNAIHTYSVEKI